MNSGSFWKYYSRRKEKAVLPSTITASKEKANNPVFCEMKTKEKIYLTLTGKLSAEFLDIQDESGAHATHAETKKSGGGHYNLTIVSAQFKDKSFLDRHRMIYDILEEEFKGEIHALAIRAYTPDEWHKINA